MYHGSPSGDARGRDEITYTDAHGRFTVDRLWPGARYILTLGGAVRGTTRHYGQALWPKEADGTKDHIGLTYSGLGYFPHEGAQRDIGQIVLPLAGGSLAGRVVDEQGQPIAGLLVEVDSRHIWNAPAYTDAEGRFQTKDLVREPLRVGIYRPGSNGGTSLGEGSSDLLLMCPAEVNSGSLELTVSDKPARR